METYPRAAVGRAMKIQEVILRAVAKTITWAQAGEIIGLFERQMLMLLGTPLYRASVIRVVGCLTTFLPSNLGARHRL